MEGKETLENFEGFENMSEIDFFGTPSTAKENTAVEQIITELEKDDIKTDVEADKTAEVKKEAKEVTEDIKFFEEDLDIEDDSTTSETTDTKKPATKKEAKPDVLSSKSMLTKLKEKGIVDFELEEGVELTDELADELLEDSYENAIDKNIGEKLSSLPDSVKDIVKFAMNGGNVEELFSKMKSEPAVRISKDMDLDDEANQTMLVKAEREQAGEDAETTETYIAFLKESGKLKAVSEKIHGKFMEKKESFTKAEATRIAKAKEESKKNERLFKKELSVFVTENDNIKGLPLGKDKTTLPSYMAEKYTLEDGRVTTKMHHDLYNALQDKEKAVLLAKLLQSDFDFSGIAKAEKTKYSKEVQRDLTRSERTTPQTSSLKTRQLADYFND